MASFITLNSGSTEYVVNVDNIDYIQASGNKCVIHFGADSKVSVDQSKREIVGKAFDATKVPEEEARRSRERLRADDASLL